MRRTLLLIAAIAACKYPALPSLSGGGDGGGSGDAPLPPGSPMLAAIEPAIAPAGATVTLEGTFKDPTTVNFPGGITATATVLGPHRATVIVPATASSGSLNVTTGGIDTGSVSFRTTSFVPKLANFRTQFEQTDAARPAPVLATARAGATAAVAGHMLYVIGGKTGNTYLDSVEGAMINADGTLGTFAPVTGATLTTARSGAVSAVIGGYVYVIGGTGTGGPINNVERAAIQADGSLGAFAPLSGVTLATARSDAASTIVGDELLVIGGTGSSGKLASIEHAVIDPDGTLEPFTTDAQTLPTARAGAAAVAAGGFLYVIGGDATSGIKTIVESAGIAPDGTLGTFAATTGVALASARAYFTAVVLGSTLYAVGGTGTAGDISTIESAALAPDGTLGSFSLVSGIQTTVSRHGAATAVARDTVFMLGGSTGAGELASVEHAAIDNDGALAAFAKVATLPLAGPRAEGASVMIGDHLYLLGGADLTTLAPRTDVDSATVQPDGTLSAFALVPGIATTGTRLGSAVAVIGGYVYLIGGTDTSTSNTGLTTVERAPINADGTLGTFAAYSSSHLVVGRSFAPVAVIGSTLYIFGGIGSGSQALITLEKAPIDASGNLGTFSSIPTTTNRLQFAHADASVAVLGNYVYVFGGVESSGNSLKVFEQGPIQNGNLGMIYYELDNTGAQMYMSVERALQTPAVIGDHLYLIAGANNIGMPADPGLRNVDHTTINSDGSLGGFSILTSATLTEGIFYQQGARAGNYVYVLGGGSHTSTTTPSEVKQALLP